MHMANAAKLEDVTDVQKCQSPKTPIEKMRTDHILDELEHLGRDVDILAPRVVLMNQLQRAREEWDAHVALSKAGVSSQPRPASGCDPNAQGATSQTDSGFFDDQTSDQGKSAVENASMYTPAYQWHGVYSGSDSTRSTDVISSNMLGALGGVLVMSRAFWGVLTNTTDDFLQSRDDESRTLISPLRSYASRTASQINLIARKLLPSWKPPCQPLVLKFSLLISCLGVFKFGLVRTFSALFAFFLALDILRTITQFAQGKRDGTEARG